MHQALQYIAYAIGLWLNLQVISALTRGSYRQYPFVSAYALILFVSTVVEIAVKAAPASVRSDYNYYYWADELILDVLVFCVVIAFIDEAARHSRHKPIERRWLILATAAIFTGSFAIHHSLPLNRQMTLFSRDLNICAVILDLILWSLLAAARRPNRRLMLLSGGLGLQLTGAIMGEQLRQFSHSLLLTGTLLEVVTGFLCLYIWWRALRTVPAPESAPA
ncbi:MAG TPA: hypothetical protein VN924_14935 [Bryobacteraceae bacterium]|jgi:hypothetical protein|nr:hypothetical protein [Bryobacteraceae bacterium]